MANKEKTLIKSKYIIHVDLASGKDMFEFVSIPISSIREKQRILSNDAEC